MKDSALIIMAKQPIIGKTKTRLSPPLSPEQATALYKALLLDTIALCSQVESVDLAVASTPPDASDYFQHVSPAGTLILPAACEDIGGCLSLVLGELLDRGYQMVLAINSDGPSLPLSHIESALKFLKDSDLVLGPSEDGGYYLIGLKTYYPALFEGIDWSTARVIGQTMNKASDLGLSIALLPNWYDIDTARDLQRLQAELDKLPPDRLAHSRRFFTRFQQAPRS